MTRPVLSNLIADFAARRALRAGSFIVTIYGDVVLPRGGSVWVGNVIETCRLVGINESQTRTAISRLVEAGHMISTRDGRRSFYRLSDAAATEFRAAARTIHGPGEIANDTPWTWVYFDGADLGEDLVARGFGQVAPGVAVKPGRVEIDSRGENCLVVLRGEVAADHSGGLARLAARAWDLTALGEAYGAFVDRFRPLEAALAAGERLLPEAGLAARLLLIHEFRRIALSDPGLPAGALPSPWRGHSARLLFRRCYDQLSPIADSHVAAHFADVDGPLRVQSPEPTAATAV